MARLAFVTSLSGLIALAPFGAAVTAQAATNLPGAAAIAHLKQAGAYNSIAAAMTAAECSQDIRREQRLASPNAGGNIGGAVAIAGKTAAVSGYVGGSEEEEAIPVVHIFIRDDAAWRLQQTLTRPNDPANAGSTGFGASVAISGDTLVVGDPTWNYQDVHRAAHVYVRIGTHWSLQQTIPAPPPPNTVHGSYAGFGGTLAIAGDILVVGAAEAWLGGQWGGYEGAAFVYVREGTHWTKQQQLLPNRGWTVYEKFGRSLAIDGETIVVGTNAELYEPGSAYVFVRDETTWTEQQRLVPPDPNHRSFGNSVALSGDTLFVGAPDSYYDTENSRPVYVYERVGTSWQPRQTLKGSDSRPNDMYGVDIAIDGDLAIVGASPFDFGDGRSTKGAAYVFERVGSTWTELQKVSGDGAGWDLFGFAVDLAEDRMIVAAVYENDYEGGAYIIKAPMVRMRITVPEEINKVNEPFTAKVVLRSLVDRPVTIAFDEPLLRTDTEDILTVETVDLPPPLTLTAETRAATFPVSVQPTKFGVAKLLSSAAVTDEIDAENICAERKVIVRPLTVTTRVTPAQTVFNQTDPALKSDRCRELEANSPIEIDPKTGEEIRTISNCIEFTAKVKNNSAQTVENVRIGNAAEPLRLITSNDLKNPGVPLTPIEQEGPEQATLAPGAEATWTWRMNAFDAPASLRFKAHASGVIDGTEVTNFGKKDFKILRNVLMKWGMRPTDGRTEYQSGHNVRADGYIENFSKDSGEEKLLRVLVYQIPEGNLGGGFVFPSTYSGPNPTQYEFFDLPAEGDGKRRDLRSVFRSSKTEKASTGTASFGIRAWIVEDDGTLTPATDQALLDSDYVDEFSVSLGAEQTPVDLYVQDCLNAGFAPILCSFNEAFAGEFVDGMQGLLQFSLQALESTGEGTVRTGAYAVWAVKELALAAIGDEQAKAALMQDLYVQYLTFHQLGVLSGQAAGQAPMVFEAFAIQAVDSIGKFIKAADEGDLTELQVQVGHFLGANPDMLLEPLVMARSFAIFGKSLAKAGGGIADNVYTSTARQKGIRQQASVEARVAAAEADPNVTDLSKALAAGDELKPNILRKVFGVSEATLKRIENFAKKNEVILAFRSRHPLAQTLLDLHKAWPKPQALKFKTVNEIDIEFLGYRRKAEATLEIVEPPAGIAGKEGTDLEQACYLYMDVLTAKHPVLKQNKVLAAEVRDRLMTRAKEWNKYVPQLKLNQLDQKVGVGVNFGAGDQ
ncbi:MAG TPA: FG-GAP repeat protein, partial [Chthoniobacterales bacterium]|nr:FG-GAP repeat protein [Chthoniobacterales bacterium]